MSRIAKGLVLAAALSPWLAGSVSAETLQGEEARRFVAGKLFAFNCFDGSRGAGRIQADGSVTGSIQLSGKGQMRYARLPSNTLQVRSGGAICASLKGMPFEPCFNVERASDSRSFRGSVNGMSFAYCDFYHQGQARVAMTARTGSARAGIGRPRSLRAPSVQQADASASEAKPEVKSEPALELRKSAD